MSNDLKQLPQQERPAELIPDAGPRHVPAAETKARILIVDDESRILNAFSQLLAAPDRVIETRNSGGAAIARLAHQDIDLLILDINLPDIRGTEIMEWIARQGLATSVIIFSGDDAIDSAILTLRRGAVEFIRKDSDPAELVSAVDYALRRRRLEREHATMRSRIEQSERLHRFLIEHSPDIIYTLDETGHFVFLNPRIESLLGYAPDELLGRHYSHVVHEDDLDQARYAFAERRIGARATFNHEIRLRCKGTGVRHFENRMVVAILSSQGIYHSEDDASARQFLGTSGVLRDITERKLAEATIAFQAYHDLLTGLPNRILFKDRLELALIQATRRNQRVGVMYIDLDRFKLVNDTYGHAEGDELLKNFARRIQHCLRAGDTLSRQGGDEFTILLPDVTRVEAVSGIAQKILSDLKPPFHVGGGDFHASASVGIAVYPEDGETADLLLRNADIAMYDIKANGKNGYRFYRPEMSSSRVRRIELDNELRTALEEGQFELHYQPQISLSRGVAVGVEALIRWNHPQRGMIPPDSFIPVAEDSGLIFAISDWVLESSCRQLAQWSRQGIEGIRMSVNISSLELGRADFVERVMAPVKAHGIAPGMLDIEITESLLLDDAETIISRVNQLRQGGVSISIDDFGTRYSSLNYLRRFAVNTVKIDQSFVRDLKGGNGSSPVISAIVGIACGFGLNVVAEGVETDEHVHALRALGCDNMQGFRFSRPLAANEAYAFLHTGGQLGATCRALALN